MAVKKKSVKVVSKKVEYVSVRKIDNGFVCSSSTGGVYGPPSECREVFCSHLDEVLCFIEKAYN